MFAPRALTPRPVSVTIALGLVATSLLGSAAAARADCPTLEGAGLQGITTTVEIGFFDSETMCGWQELTWEIGHYRLSNGTLIKYRCSELGAIAYTPPQ